MMAGASEEGGDGGDSGRHQGDFPGPESHCRLQGSPRGHRQLFAPRERGGQDIGGLAAGVSGGWRTGAHSVSS